MPFQALEPAPTGRGRFTPVSDQPTETARRAYLLTKASGMTLPGNPLSVLPSALSLFGIDPADTERSQMQGLVLGFSDEVKGAASGLGAAGSALVAGKNPVKAYQQTYQQTVQSERQAARAFHQAHPVVDTAVQLAGGAMTPGLGAAGDFVGGASSLAGTTLRSGAVGAGLGAVAGAGTADGGLMDRMRGAKTGAITGGLIGAAAPVAARAAEAVIRPAASAVGETVSAVGGMIKPRTPGAAPVLTPEAEAAAKQRALGFVDNLVNSSGKTLDDLKAHPAEGMGKPITAAEAIGRTGQYQLQTLGKRMGTTPDALEGQLAMRAIGAPDRQVADVAQTLGVHPDAARGGIEAIVQQGQAKAGPIYDEIRARTAPVWNDSLEKLSNRPVIKTALRQAATDLLNAGKDPEAVGIKVTGMLPDGSPDVVELRAPTAETWDLVKKAVSRQIDRNPVTGRPIPDSISAGNHNVTVASKDLTQAMTDAIPGYGDALKISGDYLSVRDAFDRMRGKLFNTSLPKADFQRMWNGLSESQQEAARASIANDILNLQQNARLRPKVFATPSVRAKLATAFGEAKAADLIARMEQEATLARGMRMMPGTNSTTGESIDAFGQQDSALAPVLGRAAVRGLMGDTRGAAMSLGRGLLEAAGAPIRGARQPINEAARNEAGRLLMMSPSELAAELEAFRASPPPRGMVTSGRLAPVAATAGARYTSQRTSQ